MNGSQSVAGAAAVYPLSVWVRIFLFLFAASFVAGGALGIWALSGAGTIDGWVGVAGVLGSMAVAACGVYMFASALKYRIITTDDAIEIHGVFRTTVLNRSEISGRRALQSRRDQGTIVLVPKSPGAKKMQISPGMLRSSTSFKAWLGRIPDLDAVELRKSETEILQNAAFGATPEERQKRLEAGRKVARVGNAVALGVFLWGVAYPYPYLAANAALAALPVLAMVLLLRSKGLFQIDEGRTSARPSLASMTLLPALGLAVRALTDTHVLDWQQCVVAAAVGAAVLTLLITKMEASAVPGTRPLIAIVAMTGIYSYGASLQANRLFDTSVGETFEATVVDKYVTSGRSRSWNLRLSPWGPRADTSTVSVRSSFYDTLQKGDRVCLQLHPGFVQIAWFTVNHCREHR